MDCVSDQGASTKKRRSGAKRLEQQTNPNPLLDSPERHESICACSMLFNPVSQPALTGACLECISGACQILFQFFLHKSVLFPWLIFAPGFFQLQILPSRAKPAPELLQ